MRVIKDNEELKSLIVDGKIIIDDNIECNFNINVEADINAWDINAGDINAWNITACNISAWDINAWDITARDINALGINYYASCVSYKNITCESIKGRRDNSFHKCLDGEVTIKEKLTKIEIKGETFHLNKENLENLRNQLN